MEEIHLIHPSFFVSRGPRPSRNPFSRLQNRRRASGPKLLLKNTLQGLSQLNTKIVCNRKLSGFGQNPIWIPAGDLSTLSTSEVEALADSNLTLGPNIDWFNDEIVRVVSQLDQVKVLVPHSWVLKPVSDRLSLNCRLYVWQSGVDTAFWQNTKVDPQEVSVLIYLKNLGDVDNLELVEKYLHGQKISFTTLRYGSYTQSEYKNILERVTAAIWIGGTESQGLALFECWSMDIPTLVLNKSTWFAPSGAPYPASSAPYMTEAEGMFTQSENFSESDFEIFFSKLIHFSPRNNVQQNFDLKSCASKLLQILHE